MEEPDKVACRETGDIDLVSELVAVNGLDEPMKKSGSYNDMVEVVPNGMPLTLVGIFKLQDGGFDVSKFSNLCWECVLVVVS